MQKTVVKYIDDVSKKETPKVETIEFAFEGKTYEIDLNPLNAANFRRSIDKYVKNGRKVSGRRTSPFDGRRVTHEKGYVQEVRQWAKDNGIEVAERGRVPLSVYDRFEAANAKLIKG